MAKKIEYLRMEPATNGFVVSYDEKETKKTSGTFENCSYKNCKEVFSYEDREEAFARFKELCLQQYADMNKGEKDSD